MTDLSFGEWLKRQRKAAGLTQDQLAQQVGCAAITLRKIEAGERHPSEQIATCLADIFHIHPTEQKDFLKFARNGFTSTEFPQNIPWQDAAPSVAMRLPATVNSLIGRERPIAEVREYLQNPNVHLVTLIGPPGIGKTRLSIETARNSLPDFPDGVFFIALAPINDASLIAPTIMQSLGFVDSGNLSVKEGLKNRIGEKRILLALDNCEHLIDGVAALASELLLACPHLKALTTSREALRIPGEWLYPVPTLGLPNQDETIQLDAASEFPSLTLFAERARAVRPDFQLTAENIRVVAAICAQLDGLPLAIELVAVRIRLMSPDALLERMTGQFILSANGMRAVTARQKTLNNAIGWSYDFLPKEEQKIFACLSVFSGGFMLDAAEAILSDLVTEKPLFDVLHSLADKSLLQRLFHPNGTTRFQTLVTIQEFALEHLRRMGEEENIRSRHLRYFVGFSEQAGRELIGPRQVEWSVRVLEERDNLRAALGWAAKIGAEEGMYLAANLGSRFWENFNIQEGIRWLTEFLQKPEAHFQAKARVRALNVLGYLQLHFQRFDLMRSAVESALALSRSIGDRQGECDSLNILGSVMQFLEGMEAKANFQTQALLLARAIGDVWREADALSALSWDKRDLAKAFAYREQSIRLYRQVGDWQGLAHALSVFASDVALSGDMDRAQSLLDEYSTLNQHVNDKRNLEFVLTAQARIALARGETQLARSCLEKNMGILQELGNRMGYLWARVRLGYVLLTEGDHTAARQIFVECIREFQKVNNRAGLIFPMELMATLFLREGKFERAVRLLGWAEATRNAIGDTFAQWLPVTESQNMKIIHENLGEEEYTSAKNEGADMTVEQVIACALETDFL